VSYSECSYPNRITLMRNCYTVSSLQHVMATIFGHHKIAPPLVRVYNWGRSCLLCRFLVIDLKKCPKLYKPLSWCFRGYIS
jgi:hypothetical protein